MNSKMLNDRKGWHSRGYLPHFDAGEVPQAITFRLAGSLPGVRLEQWREELHYLASVDDTQRYSERIETYLDRGLGETWLARPEIAAMVENALLYFDGNRYALHAWVVMPNHVHVLVTPYPDVSLSAVVHSWKSYVAVQANRRLDRSGAFWQPDYFDQYIRSQLHFDATREYITHNPVAAGLCATPREWPFGSARFEDRSGEGCGQDVRAPVFNDAY